ncbi:MAG: peptidoglycan-binding domain-containing protein [Acidimicrobiales bacterium]
MGRRRTLVAVAAISIVATSGAWYAGSRISTPAEARAHVKEPKPSLITAPVERRALSSNVIVRGDLTYDESTPINLASLSETKAVITKDPPEVGSVLADGQVLTEVNGRPVFVIQGDLPVFRSLSAGATGDDVTQLEAGLARLGVDPGPVDGTFDGSTQAAITAFYRRAGYSTKEPTAEARDAAESADAALTAARQALRSAENAAKDSGAGIKTSERLQLQSAVDSATAALEAAKAAAVTASKEASAQQASLANELEQARAAKRQADATLADAQVPGALDPDTGDPYTNAKLTELANATVTTASAIVAKQAEIDSTAAAATDTAREKFEAIAQADRDLRIAQAAQLEGLKPADGSSAATELADARQAVEAATKHAEAAQADVGVTVPLGEVVFVRALPRQVNEVHLRRGDVATGAVVTISGADLKIRSSVVAADRALLTVGAKVKVDENDLDVHFTGVISEIADTPGGDTGGGTGGTGNSSSSGDSSGGLSGDSPNASGSGDGSSSGVASDKYRVVIVPGALPDGETVDSLAGVNFRITVPVKSTAGEVLAVPLAALSATADGGVRVEVEDSPGRTRFVRVTRGLAAQGYAEVAPVKGARLTEGDQVVVGA